MYRKDTCENTHMNYNYERTCIVHPVYMYVKRTGHIGVLNRTYSSGQI